ncbi:MAG: NADH-quinone oxidoreductase subunit NuoH [Gemmataceae bacterium]|nr:NADH-quinone oxidoreductase subunit NuoH [Gemmataceae bacterium]
MVVEFSLIVTLATIIVLMACLNGLVAYLTLFERKISAYVQDRVGPNRAFFGIVQPIADGIKFLLKEDVIPAHVDKFFYLLAPAIALGTAFLAIAVVPFGSTLPPPALVDHRPGSTTFGKMVFPSVTLELEEVLQADRKFSQDSKTPSYEEKLKKYNATFQCVVSPGVDIGFVFVFAVGSLAVYGIILGGWSSNNKYSLLGSLRSSAQLISYEIPMGLSVLGVAVAAGSLNMERIIHHQVENGWNFIFQPLAMILFATAIFAECNRLPFDLPEAEQELVGGYHTEYSAMKFALFFLGEYTHMITTSFLIVTLFFGGWHLPFLTSPDQTGLFAILIKVGITCGKMLAFIFFYMMIRWTILRFRFDQLMNLAWKVMLPLSLLSFLALAGLTHFRPLGNLTPWVMPPISLGLLLGAGLLGLILPKSPTRSHVPNLGHGSGGIGPVCQTNQARLEKVEF